jgi:hypothetical protein
MTQAGDSIARRPSGPVRQPVDLTNDALITNVAKQVGGGITPEQVAAVIAAWHAIHDGDPVGTVRRDPETGAVGIRVEDQGYHLWRVTVPNGEFYNDLQPTLPWPEL